MSKIFSKTNERLAFCGRRACKRERQVHLKKRIKAYMQSNVQICTCSNLYEVTCSSLETQHKYNVP